MNMHFDDAEGRVLHGLIEGAWDDVVLRLDGDGFVDFASPNASGLGFDPSAMLVLPHVCDFAQPEYAPMVAHYVSAVIAGESEEEWIEFPLNQAFVHLTTPTHLFVERRPVS